MKHLFITSATAFLWAALLCLALPARAQITFDESQLFKTQVKDISNFTRLFNLEESMAGGSLPKDKKELLALRQKQLLSLFDRPYVTDANPAKRAMLKVFVEQMAANNLHISAAAPETYMESTLQTSFKGSPQNIKIVFKNLYDAKKQNYWSIASADASFLNPQPKAEGSPVNEQSEDLNAALLGKGAAGLSAYAAPGTGHDKYAVFYFLLQNGLLETTAIEAKAYHFLEIDGWGIVVKPVKNDAHGGWLITSVFQTTPDIKNDYKAGMLGIGH
jgi:hypothetical protein